MSRVAHYLQEHLMGEVTANPEIRRHFAHDASILRLAPAIVVYPRNESDVRKTASFCWQLAQRGRSLPITARGGGSDMSGAAIGGGIVLLFTAHMNKILELDPKKELLTVEPGATYDKVEQTLYTHGLFLPPYPASLQYATLGGGIANNAVGEKSVKYGPTGDYVERLRVVLANGEVIESHSLNRRELSRKMGLSTLEGEIYRGIDKLLEENSELINRLDTLGSGPYSSLGYNLSKVKTKKSFDLTPLFIGSQGTLGIITEATLHVAPHNPLTRLALVSFTSLNDLSDVLPKILALKPSVCDMLNKAALDQVLRINPNQLVGMLNTPAAPIHLFIEFDDTKDATQKTAVKNLKKIAEKVDADCVVAETLEDQEKLRKVRQSVSTILIESHGPAKAVPIAEDVYVPVEALIDFLVEADRIYQSVGLSAAAWGHAGSGIVRMHPLLDLGQTGDRQKLFRLADSIYAAALKAGGSISAAHGAGRTRAPYMVYMYGQEIMDLMRKLKKVFDPHNVLNPGVKFASIDEVKALLRSEYNLNHHHEHLPRS